MKIEINDYRKVHAIQEEFNTFFPGLKIEFYSKPAKQGGAPSEKIMASGSRNIVDCRTIHDSGTLTLTPLMTIADLERSFSDVFGLTVEVMRKAGGSWVIADHKNDWSLEQQNATDKESVKSK